MERNVSKPRIYKVNGRWYASIKVQGITLLIPGQFTIDGAWKTLRSYVAECFGLRLAALRATRSGEKSRSASCRSVSVKMTQQ